MTSAAIPPASVTPKRAEMGIDDPRINTLFSRLSAMYGHLWWNGYPTEQALIFAKKEWFEALHHVDNRTLKESLVLVRKQSHYPPTLPYFIECCNAVSRRYQRDDSFPPTVDCPTDLAVGERYLKQLLMLLKR